jgi:hypothetical protein
MRILKRHLKRAPFYWAWYRDSIYCRTVDYVICFTVILCIFICIWMLLHLPSHSVVPVSDRVAIKRLTDDLNSSPWWRDHGLHSVNNMTYLRGLSRLAKSAGISLSNVLLVKSTSKHHLKLHEYTIDSYGTWRHSLSFLQHLDLLPGVQSWNNCKLEVTADKNLHLQLQLYNWQRVRV